MNRKQIAALILAGAMSFSHGGKASRYTATESAKKVLVESREENIHNIEGTILNEINKSNVVQCYTSISLNDVLTINYQKSSLTLEDLNKANSTIREELTNLQEKTNEEENKNVR